MDSPNVSSPIYEGNLPAHGLNGDLESHPVIRNVERESVGHSPDDGMFGDQCPPINFNIINLNNSSGDDVIKGVVHQGENSNSQADSGSAPILSGPPEIGNEGVENGPNCRPSYITKRPNRNSKKAVKSAEFKTPDLNDRVVEKASSDPFDIESIFIMEQH
ncbi:hypothetical protein Hanom_Chr16g01460301 [Helianthus anomalus]